MFQSAYLNIPCTGVSVATSGDICVRSSSSAAFRSLLLVQVGQRDPPVVSKLNELYFNSI